jgi:hypothetical protein
VGTVKSVIPSICFTDLSRACFANKVKKIVLWKKEVKITDSTDQTDRDYDPPPAVGCARWSAPARGRERRGAYSSTNTTNLANTLQISHNHSTAGQTQTAATHMVISSGAAVAIAGASIRRYRRPAVAACRHAAAHSACATPSPARPWRGHGLGAEGKTNSECLKSNLDVRLH